MGDLDLTAAAREAPDGLAWVDHRGRSQTWASMAAAAAGVAERVARLAAQAGLGAEDPVTFVATSEPRTFVLIHALIASGRPFVPLHPRFTAAEVGRLEGALGARLDVTSVGFEAASEVTSERPGAARRVTSERAEAPLRVTSETVELAEAGGAGAPRTSVQTPPDDDKILAILTSSGTTGEPKGVVLSRRAFAAAARASAVGTPLASGDRWVICMPLAHAGGLSIVTRALAARATVILQPRFDPGEVLRAASELGATHLSVVPTMLRSLLDHHERRQLSTFRVVLVGGASCPDTLLAEARRMGCPAIATYGATEACSQITTQPLADRDRVPDGDSGLPLPGVEIAIDEGEVLVRSPALMTGYRGSPRVPAGGWFRTGDLGELREDGRLVVLARLNDRIITGGENVDPTEVEAALLATGGIREAVAVGVEDPRWGQIVAAILVVEPGTEVDRVLTLVAADLAPHKRPRRVAVVSGPLPRTTKGDLDRRAALRLHGVALG